MILYHLQKDLATTFLYLCIERQENIIIGLRSEKVPTREAELIKENKAMLESFSYNEKITWLKENTPISYNRAFRRLDLNQYNVIGESLL